MEDTEDAQDAWTKPAATFKIKRTKSIGRPTFSNITKQTFTSTSNPVKRMNPFGMVSSSKFENIQHDTRWVIQKEVRLARGLELKTPWAGF